MTIVVRDFPIVEEEMADALREYLVADHFDERYRNFGIPRVGIVHPFSIWIDQGQYDQELLPSVTVASGTDQQTPEVSDFRDFGPTTLAPEDLPDLTAAAFDVSEEDRGRLQQVFDSGRNAIYGVSAYRSRSDQVNFEIWSDAPHIKNKLFNVVEGFLVGPERGTLKERSGFYVRAETISGQRGNNYSTEFGKLLYGGMIAVTVDYMVVETIYDTGMTAEPDVRHWHGGIVHGG